MATQRIVTASGRVLVASTGDDVLCGDSDPSGTWRSVGTLGVGDRIAVERVAVSPVAPIAMDLRVVAFIAQMIGDGSYLTNQPLRYASGCEHNTATVEAGALALGSTSRRVYTASVPQVLIGGNGNRWRNTGALAYMKSIGMWDTRAHEKRVPSVIFRLSNADVALFLRHLWATDGTISTSSRTVAISYSTTSELLARDVASLLLRFGIVARMVCVKGKKAQHHDVWFVNVSGAADQRRFLSDVGMFGRRVAPGEVAAKMLASVEANTNVDTLPMGVWSIVHAARKRHGISQRKMSELRGTKYGGSSHYRFAPSREVIASYAEILNDDALRAWVASPYFWDRVVSVSGIGVGFATSNTDGIVAQQNGRD